MKKILSILSVTAMIAIILVACNSKNRSEADAVTRLKAYQDSVKFSADTVGLSQFQAWKAQQNQLALATISTPVRSSTKTSTASRNVKSTAGATKTGSLSTTTQSPAKAKPTGWSKAAKGAVIGAAGGAVAGAVINKRNRAVGAAIGGVAGGVIGYGVGRHLDKKDGRY